MAKCGVSFRVWKIKDKSGKDAGFDFSSLVGGERKKLLQRLPDELAAGGALHPESLDAVLDVWRKFSSLYDTINQDHASESDALSCKVFEMAIEWIQSFLNVSQCKRRFYAPENITPYELSYLPCPQTI